MWEKELQAAKEAGLLAREAILEVYHQEFDVEIKDDDSPVTQADKKADKIIKEYLKERFPSHAFLTEESEDDLSRLKNDYVWIIDPVDGTKDFVAKDDEFTTCIALSYKHEVVVGVVIVPASGEIYFATKDGGSFYEYNGLISQIHVNDKTSDLTCLTSKFHLSQGEVQLIEKYQNLGVITNVYRKGSSLKPCYIARGLAEITYRVSPNTKEWDTAANQIIVEEAGGLFIEPNGKRLTYNRKDVYNRNGYIAVNRKENILL